MTTRPKSPYNADIQRRLANLLNEIPAIHSATRGRPGPLLAVTSEILSAAVLVALTRIKSPTPAKMIVSADGTERRVA